MPHILRIPAQSTEEMSRQNPPLVKRVSLVLSPNAPEEIWDNGFCTENQPRKNVGASRREQRRGVVKG